MITTSPESPEPEKDYQAECECGWKSGWEKTKVEAEERLVYHLAREHDPDAPVVDNSPMFPHVAEAIDGV